MPAQPRRLSLGAPLPLLLPDRKEGRQRFSTADDLADYVQLRARIAWLNKMHQPEVSSMPSLATDRAMKIGRDINAAVALSQKLAERLGWQNK